MKSLKFGLLVLLPCINLASIAQSQSPANPYLQHMRKAAAHAKASGAQVPVLSPVDVTVLHKEGSTAKDSAVPIDQLHEMGIRIVPWTTNDPDHMRALIRMGVDGIITDRPDVLQRVLAEERSAASPAAKARLAGFDVAAHRGGRGLRPENTLPSFESGLDQLSTTLETDTGVSTDHVSTIWHDQFYSPQSCRRADGQPYNLENRIYLRDISSSDAQKTLICDKLHFGSDQKNHLALSPVSVAFAAKEGLQNPYVPTYVDQLFRFVRFYVDYYRTGPGKSSPLAAQRAANAEKVRFNLETKILPELKSSATPESERNHTVPPELFVATLAGTIERYKMEQRSEIQSFDFRTLVLTEEHHPAIPTYYLTGDPKTLSTELVPDQLRAAP